MDLFWKRPWQKLGEKWQNIEIGKDYELKTTILKKNAQIQGILGCIMPNASFYW